MRISDWSSDVCSSDLMHRRLFLSASSAVVAGVALAAAFTVMPAAAQSRKETLVVLVENGPNSMDIHGVGTSFRSYVAAWSMYDRLVTFGRKKLADGTLRSEEHTSELQSLMRTAYALFCLKKKKQHNRTTII